MLLILFHLDHIQSHIRASFIYSWMPSHTFKNMSFSSVIPICFHRQDQTFSPTTGHVPNTLIVSVEKSRYHLYCLIFKYSQRVKHNRVQCVIMDVLVETFSSELAVLLGMLIDVSKGLSCCGVEIGLLSFLNL